MDITADYFNSKKDKAKALYTAQKALYNPYFKTNIILTSEGFHHLQFSSGRERNRREQLLKLRLLPLALEIIRKAGTIQEYRKLLVPIGKPSARDGSIPMKEVEYWGLVAIVGEQKIKVRTVLRRVGDGNITFWSTMLYSKIKNGNQRLFTEDMMDS